MKITTTETREYLSLNMPQWLGVLEANDSPHVIFHTAHGGLWYNDCRYCLIGELRDFDGSYTTYSANRCSECIMFSGIVLYIANDGEYKPNWQDLLNQKLDEIVSHMKECHPVPEIKIPIEVTV